MLTLKANIMFDDELPLRTSLLKIMHQPAHFHENAIEIILILKGVVNIRSSHRHIVLYKGDIFSIDPGDTHCIYSDVDNIILQIHLDTKNDLYPQERIYNCFFACETQNIQVYQTEAFYKVKDLILAGALEYMITDFSPSKPIIKNISNLLIQTLIKHFDWLSFIWDPTDSNPLMQERFHRIISYCQENYKEKISISMLAEKEHFNENYFSTLMRKTSFEGFSNMLNFFRCDGAERLLLTTDKSVIEISDICGFSDPKYFYKHFNKWWNTSPAKLRKWYREYTLSETCMDVLTPHHGADILKEYLAEYHIDKLSGV